MEAIRFEGVGFTYPTSEYPVLSNIDFTVKKGEFCLVMGKSAAGKSSLLKLIKKEIAPAGRVEGNITVGGTVGYVAQNVDESIVCDKVRAELSFGLTNMGVSGDRIELLVAEIASYFNLEDKLDNNISSLSGGEKQMVNLAAVMIMKPDTLVLDEPTSQLDPVATISFIEMVKRLHRDFGITVIIAEHNTENLYSYADSVALVTKGEGLYKCTPSQMTAYLKSTSDDMIGAVPVYMRLFDNADTFNECRRIIENKALTAPVHDKKRPDAALRASHLTFAYKRGVDVLNGVDFTAYEHCINAVVGPNSSGKTTLMLVLAGVYKAHRGRIKKSGKVSMLCQNPYDLFTKDVCADEIPFGELTVKLGIDEIRDKHPYDISAGQAQRLALAKVLSTGADIIILDEPTKALDSVLKLELSRILKSLCDEGKTIIIVSHDIEFIGQYCDYASFLSRGRIVATEDRRGFFSRLNFYTTAVSRITNGISGDMVSVDDLTEAGAFCE